MTRAVAHNGTPLTYFRGKFGRFESQQDRVVYGELRNRILTRLISLEASLDIGVLAQDFDVLRRPSRGRDRACAADRAAGASRTAAMWSSR